MPVGWIDEDVAPVAGGHVVPGAEPRQLAQRAVVLGATPEPRRARGVGGDGAELRDLQPVGSVLRIVEQVHLPAVEVDPVDLVEVARGCAAGMTAPLVRAVPDTAVRADQCVLRVVRVEDNRVEVGVLVKAKVLPGRASIVRAEDAPRRRGERVTEGTGRKDDVGVARIRLDDVVVSALRAAVTGYAVEPRGETGAHPGSAGVDRLVHAGDAANAGTADARRCARPVDEVETDVKNG